MATKARHKCDPVRTDAANVFVLVVEWHLQKSSSITSSKFVVDPITLTKLKQDYLVWETDGILCETTEIWKQKLEIMH